jgi:hypothetical protein
MKTRFSSFVGVMALVFSIGVAWLSTAPAGNKVQIENVVSSPSHQNSLILRPSDSKSYNPMSFKGRAIVLSSPLSFDLRNGAMKTGFTLLNDGK